MDILEHKLVPKHEVLSDSEIEEAFKDLDFEKDQLPKIKSEDPVVLNIGAKIGDILRITRFSQTAGTYVTYRLVED